MMCRVTLWHMKEFHVSQVELESRLGLKPLDACLAQRRLRWAGHVYRMDFERLPRKLLTSWVDHPRPRGRPQFHFGHGLARDLTNAGVDIATWHQAAANRTAWQQLTERSDICKLKKPPISVSQASPSQTPQPPQAPQPSPPSTSFRPTTTSPSPPRAPPALPPPSPLLALPSAALLPTPCSPLNPTLTSILSLPSRSPLALALPSILRCSSRLAEMARQAGGRRVYSLKPIIHS